MPPSERFGLQSQIRRSAVSVPTNIVEGSARTSDTEYGRFIELAHASSRECAYLIGLAARLGFMDVDQSQALLCSYNTISGGLSRLWSFLKPDDTPRRELAPSPKPRAPSQTRP